MAGLSSLFGYKGGNPLLDYVNSNRSMILGLGAGIAGGGPDFGQAVGRGLQLAGQGQEADQQRELLNYQRQQQDTETNATRAWLQSHYPQYASLPPAEGFQLAMKDMAGGSGQGQLGLTPIWGTDKAGNPVLGQLSNQGGIVPVQMPDGVTFGKEPIRLDAGDRFVLLDPVTRQQIGYVPKTGNVPEGYEPSATGQGIQPMPGSPAADKVKAAQDQAAAKQSAANVTSDTIIGAAQKARDLADSFATTGLMGAVAGNLPISDAAELRRQVKVLTSNATISALNQMRQQSPTGGALGNVTEGEGQMLAAAAGAINPDSSPEDFKAQLDNYELTLLRIIHGYDAGTTMFQQLQGGAGGNAGPAVAAPTGSASGKTLTYNPATGELE